MQEQIKKELSEEFLKDLRYYPLINRISGITTEIGKILENAAQRMCQENKTTPQDIGTAKETINLLKMSLTTVFNPNIQSSISDVQASNALDQALNGICPIWPLCR